MKKKFILLAFFVVGFCNANELDSKFWDKEFYVVDYEKKCADLRIKTIKKDRTITIDDIMEINNFNIIKEKSLGDNSYLIKFTIFKPDSELYNSIISTTSDDDLGSEYGVGNVIVKLKDNKANFIFIIYEGKKRYEDDHLGWLEYENSNNYPTCHTFDDVGDEE